MLQDNKTQTTQQKPVTLEKATNCIICNKPLKRIRRYYRNGKFYCSKGCYKKNKAKTKKTNASIQS